MLYFVPSVYVICCCGCGSVLGGMVGHVWYDGEHGVWWCGGCCVASGAVGDK